MLIKVAVVAAVIVGVKLTDKRDKRHVYFFRIKRVQYLLTLGNKQTI